MILCDDGEFGNTVTSELEKIGHTCISVLQHEIEGESRKVLDENLTSSAANGTRLRRVLYLWGLGGNGESPPEQLPENALRTTQMLLKVAQSISDTELHTIEALTVVTRGTQKVTGKETHLDLEAAPLWGCTRVIANEFPQWCCSLIDIDPDTGLKDIENFLPALLHTRQPAELAIREGHRYLPSMHRVDVEALDYRPVNDASGYTVATTATGPLDNLYLRELQPTAPGAGELEVEIIAAGLNFRDILKAMGNSPDDGESDLLLGDECAGRVINVGAQVQGFDIGDRVMVVTPGALSSHVTVTSDRVIGLPDNISFEEAAGFPIVFLTAWYALVEIARVQEGERVLIHAAAGGVGQAAIQIARLFGVEVFATAGSKQKRELLRTQGIEHIFDSRSLDFVDGINEATHGRGVDVVVNSLAGDFLSASLAVVAPYGRFVELGKRDIYSGGKLSLDAFKHNVSFSAVDLSQLLQDQPKRALSILQELVSRLGAGELRPVKVTPFSFSQADAGFRFLAQAKHVGKVILSCNGAEEKARVVRESAEFSPKNAYLVVGGLGGFGLETTEWLARYGARHIFVMTRTATPPYSDAIQQTLKRLREDGTEIFIERGDVSDHSDVRRIIKKIDRMSYPLKGIIHAAMIIDDGFVARMTTEIVEKVVNPKVAGAWWLHTETKGKDLDFFVLFSSVSALLGAIGQSNYAAANAFLDSLAHYRNSQSLAALSINWGSIADVGYCARHPDVKTYLEQSAGIKSIPAKDGLSILGVLMQRQGAQFGVMKFSPEKLQKFIRSDRQRSRFSEILDDAPEHTKLLPSVTDITRASPENQQQMLVEYLSVQLAEVLGVEPSAIDPDAAISNAGLDSLMRFEFVVRVERGFGLSLAGSRMLQSDLNLRQVAEIVFAGIETKK